MKVAELIPHGPRARLVDRIVSVEAQAIVCLGSVPARAAYVRDGSFPSFVLLEMAAQAAAAFEIASAREGGAEARPGVGYLVRAQAVTSRLARVPAGIAIELRVERTGSAGALQQYACVARHDGAELFSGRFSTLTPTATGSRTTDADGRE